MEYCFVSKRNAFISTESQENAVAYFKYVFGAESNSLEYGLRGMWPTTH